MTHMSTTNPEELRIDVRNKSKDLIKVLASHRELSIAGRARTQLRRGYVTNALLDTLVEYYPDDVQMMAAVQCCRDALTKWQDSPRYKVLVWTKRKGWIT